MRSFLRCTTLAASLLVTVWAVPGCSSNEDAGGNMDAGAMDKGKMGGGAMSTGKMDAVLTWDNGGHARSGRRCHGQGQDG